MTLHTYTLITIVPSMHTQTHRLRSVYTQSSPGCQIIISAIIKQTDQHHPHGRERIGWFLSPHFYCIWWTCDLCLCSKPSFCFPHPSKNTKKRTKNPQKPHWLLLLLAFGVFNFNFSHLLLKSKRLSAHKHTFEPLYAQLVFFSFSQAFLSLPLNSALSSLSQQHVFIIACSPNPSSPLLCH